MRSLNILTLSTALMTGCFGKTAALSAAPAAAARSASQCDDARTGIRQATYSEAVKAAVRDYLTCVVSFEPAPPDLPQRVRAELDRNPYPAATSREDVHGWFFDLDKARPVPGTTLEMQQSIRVLEDQALARTAMGQIDVAQAAQGRAAKLRRLGKVLEHLEG